MMQDIGCPPTASKGKLRFESVSFPEIPSQSNLFLQYQSDPLSLRKYYPSAVASHTEIAHRTGEVLDNYSTDRDELCDALFAQNTRFRAEARVMENIDLLRRDGTVAILTGQQAGLFTGPLYTVYKALSAIRMAECFRNRGIDAVAVFWAATEDHDFEEISKAFFLGSTGTEVEFALPPADKFAGLPVGKVPIPASFDRVFADQMAKLPDSEWKDDVAAMLGEWKSGRLIADSFCSQLQVLFKNYGLIVVDPLDPGIKKLSAPIYSDAVSRSEEIVSALVERSKELEVEGYHAQVQVSPDYFPLFYHGDDAVRRAIRRRGDEYQVIDTKTRFTKNELIELARDEPDRFSPGVMLRPIVQDHLFPTVCYFGGAAEVAYFAQNSEVYRILGRPPTAILHRQSFTLVEPRHARALEKYDLKFADMFRGFDDLRREVVERYVNPSAARLFADAEEGINLHLNSLDQELSSIDPTLAANLATRRRKIAYHLAALRKKFHRVQLERDEIADRRLRSLFGSLLPDGHLQERKLNVGNFLLGYGPQLIDWIYDAVDLDERGHRLLYL